MLWLETMTCSHQGLVISFACLSVPLSDVCRQSRGKKMTSAKRPHPSGDQRRLTSGQLACDQGCCSVWVGAPRSMRLCLGVSQKSLPSSAKLSCNMKRAPCWDGIGWMWVNTDVLLQTQCVNQRETSPFMIRFQNANHYYCLFCENAIRLVGIQMNRIMDSLIDSYSIIGGFFSIFYPPFGCLAQKSWRILDLAVCFYQCNLRAHLIVLKDNPMKPRLSVVFLRRPRRSCW